MKKFKGLKITVIVLLIILLSLSYTNISYLVAVFDFS